jgi:hypothetical protein
MRFLDDMLRLSAPAADAMTVTAATPPATSVILRFTRTLDAAAPSVARTLVQVASGFQKMKLPRGFTAC